MISMTYNILTIIIIVTLLVSVLAFNNRELLNRLIYVPHDVKHHKSYTGILGHILIHADWGHLAFNMLSLYFLGDVLLNAPGGVYQDVNGGLIYEYGEWKGQLHFIILYVFGALFATLIPYVRNQDNSSYRSLGASGAVSAVIFAAILWNPGMELMLFFIPIAIPAYIFGPLYLLFEYFMDRRGGSGIAHDAHIGGALFGIFYVLISNFDRAKGFIEYFV